jgi:hypothetical protein
MNTQTNDTRPLPGQKGERGLDPRNSDQRRSSHQLRTALGIVDGWRTARNGMTMTRMRKVFR